MHLTHPWTVCPRGNKASGRWGGAALVISAWVKPRSFKRGDPQQCFLHGLVFPRVHPAGVARYIVILTATVAESSFKAPFHWVRGAAS